MSPISNPEMLFYIRQLSSVDGEQLQEVDRLGDISDSSQKTLTR